MNDDNLARVVMSEGLPREAVRLSVIIPFAPNETEGDVLLDQLRDLPVSCEIIVVRTDGPRLPLRSGRTDSPIHECLSRPGRAHQMNVGAQVARGRWLWFLHADSRLRPRTLARLRAWFDRKLRWVISICATATTARGSRG